MSTHEPTDSGAHDDETLARRLAEQARLIAHLTAERDRLTTDLSVAREQRDLLAADRERLQDDAARLATEHAQLQAEAARLADENRLLRQKVDDLARQLFGKSAEKVTGAEIAAAVEQSREPPAPPPPPFVDEAMDVEENNNNNNPAPKRPRKGHGRRRLPAALPRTRVPHELSPEERRCPCCGDERRPFGEDVTEVVEYVPASFRIIEHVRTKYSCARCQGEVVCAPMPQLPITKGRPGPGTLAYVVTAKYCDHLPLHRLERIIWRDGLDVRRSTLCDWVRETAWLLAPIAREVERAVKAAAVVGVDATGIRVRDKTAPGGIHKGHMWAYRGEPGDVAFVYAPTKSGDGPVGFLGDYHGFLLADAANSYDQLYEGGKIVECGCWAHARRRWYKAKDAFPKEAGWALAAIRRLYEIEAEAKAKNLDPERRLALRRERTAPIIAGFFEWLRPLRPSVVPKTLLADAVGYAVNQEAALRRFLEDGRIAADNNAVERALRQIAVGRRAWLFAGSENGAKDGATLYTLVVSCRDLGLDPFEYLRDVLERLATHPEKRIAELTPRGWLAARERAAPP